MLRAIVPGGSPTNDAEAFTSEAVAAFRKMAPDQKIEIEAPLQLRVTSPNGSTHTVWLGNLQHACLADPDSREALLERFSRALIAPVEAAVLSKNVVPVIRNHEFMSEWKNMMAAHAKAGDKKTELATEPFAAELVIAYVCDNPDTVQYLNTDGVAEIHLSGQTLRELAVENLRRILPDIQSQGAHGFFVFSAGNCYEPSLVLMDSLWEGFRQNIKGQIIFGIPTRNTLFVADSTIPEAVAHLVKATWEVFSQEPYRISEKVYVRHSDRIEIYSPDEESLSS